MNWDVASAFAEVVGAAAVVISIVYLAVQLRLARIASEAQLSYASVGLYSQWRTSLMQNSDLARTIAKANRGENLEDEEMVLLTVLSDELFVASAVSHASVLRAESIHNQSLELKYLMDFFEANPGMITQWQRFRSSGELISLEFCNAVDAQLQQLRNSDI